VPVNDDRRLIEDYLPIEAISAEASREKSVRKGHISTLHIWWARRPLVACRAAVYGALVPASRFIPENGTEEEKATGREHAAEFLSQLCKYPGSPSLIAQAQHHILEAHAKRLTSETGRSVTVDDITADRAPHPKVLDVFAGGGSIPLEALRLGCDTYALELNPVAHLIELCTLVYPQKFGRGDSNVRGAAGPKNALGDSTWGGLSSEVRYWGKWVLGQLQAEIGDLYSPIPDPRDSIAPQEIGSDQLGFDEKVFGRKGQLEITPSRPHGSLIPSAYFWTRTVKCKNPNCRAVVPLVRQTWLCEKPGRYVALRPVVSSHPTGVRFEVVESSEADGLGFDPESFSKAGAAACFVCGTVADGDYVKVEGKAGRLAYQLLAVVCRHPKRPGAVYLAASDAGNSYPAASRLHTLQERLAERGVVAPSEELVGKAADQVPTYGMPSFGDLFLDRPRLYLLTLVDLIRNSIAIQAREFEYPRERERAIRTYLALALDRVANYLTSLCVWRPSRSCVLPTFSRQALAMAWDFGEMNPFGGSAGDWMESVDWVADVIDSESHTSVAAAVFRGSADSLSFASETMDAVVTDPPYYDNVLYSDLADFFYVWLKRAIGDLYPEHFGTQLSPKLKEAVSSRFRHRSGGDARHFYESMMLGAFSEAHRVLKPNGSLVCIYAHKTTSGWATLVNALRSSRFEVTEAWPIDTEMTGGMRVGTSSLASSILLVARKRSDEHVGLYEDVNKDLAYIARGRVRDLWAMGVSGADLVIAAVGAGLRAFTRFDRVEYANGEEVPAERFLAEVEGVVLETVLEKIFAVSQTGIAAVDAPSRFYVLWRFTYRAAEVDAGEAIVFTYGQPIELDGPRGLSSGPRPLVEKKKSKYQLRDFSGRGDDEKLGIPNDTALTPPLVDVLHRALWLMEHQPAALAQFLDQAKPNVEHLRMIAQALAGPALQGGELRGPRSAEQTALATMLANWRNLIEENLFRHRD
jgi:putative DNA methylase